MGIIVTAIGVGGIWITLLKKPLPIVSALLSTIAAAFVATIVIVRNILLSGSVVGRNHAAGQPWLYQFVQSMYVIGNDWMGLVGGIVYWNWRLFVTLVVTLGLVRISAVAVRQRKTAFLAAFVMLYVPLFCLFASFVRIDMINTRFMAPIYPYIALLFVYSLFSYSALFWHRNPDRRVVWCQGILLFAGVSVIGRAAAHFRWRYLLEQYGRNGELTTACALVLTGVALVSLSVCGSRLIRRLTRANVTIETWNRHSALQDFISRKVGYVVFCHDQDRCDSILSNNCYGSYIPRLLDGKFPEAKSIHHFRDGVIIELENQPKLTMILRSLAK